MRVPLFVEMQGKSVLIIGGGGEGVNRARKFSRAGASVKVLSIEFSEELKEMDGVELIEGDARDEDLLDKLMEGVDLVVVALPTAEQNESVIRLAKKHGALVNLANDAEATEVVVPFEDRVGSVRLAITSEGRSGLVVRDMLRELRDCLSAKKELFSLMDLMYRLKLHMKSIGVDPRTRIRVYHIVYADERFRELVRRGDERKAWERVEEILQGVLDHALS